MIACPDCEKDRSLLVALQPYGLGQKCPHCEVEFQAGAGREVSRRELIDLLTGRNK